MDRETRNRIQRATQDARALLEREYAEQLAGTFDIRLDGTVGATPGGHLDAGQRLVRAKLVTAIEHLRAAGHGKDAVAAYVREAAFTTLNRFVALKMLEARGLVQECLSRGEDSSGFKEFVGLAPGLVQIPDHGFRLYIESLFDEIGREVRVLFDRRDPASLLWPRRQPLLDLLAMLNAAELAPVWGEDETIGWVYQYFNSDEERRQMRAESQAPRNSRELAVRNQFFTPRYVVQFLTDNTLGRIWYEMRRGETKLGELEYLVRHPNEVFLAEGEEPPGASDGNDDDVSQEELLRRPVHVPFRATKDPRDIRVLDPACGSGHFLLYAFDLLLVIYEEAWADEASPKSEVTGRTLREDHSDLADLRAAVPGLILRHNLHGIDIDARCAQIAALALWMRAQRAFKDLGLAREARLPIQKTNIVVAEPMPGESELRREFIATLDAKLGQLVERVFDRMELAGEAGSLVRIEDDIRDAVREIYGEHGQLFRASDEERWRQAEGDVLRALRSYAERAAKGRAFQRRLFAQDAARGLGFIDLCGHRYDVVLMNPPFGQTTSKARDQLAAAAVVGREDVGSAMVTIGLARLATSGLLGAITNRTYLAIQTAEDWRRRYLLGDSTSLFALADLGYGVLDGAMVEAACYVVSSESAKTAFFIYALEDRDKSRRLLSSIVATREPRHGHPSSAARIHRLDSFRKFACAVVAHWLPAQVLGRISQMPGLGESIGKSKAGFDTGDNFRFLRLVWEVRPQDIGSGDRTWALCNKGGEYSPYYEEPHLVVRWASLERELSAISGARVFNTEYCFRVGVVYPMRTTSDLSPRPLPPSAAFNKGAQFIDLDDTEAAGAFVALAYTRPFKVLVEATYGGGDVSVSGSAARNYTVGVLESVPIPVLSPDVRRELNALFTAAAREAMAARRSQETSLLFTSPYASCVGPLGRFCDLVEKHRLSSAKRVMDLGRAAASADRAVAKLYGFDEAALTTLWGPHPFSYVQSNVPAEARPSLDATAASLLSGQWSDASDGNSEFEGSRRVLTKKGYFADRAIEVLAHTAQVHPSEVLKYLDTMDRWQQATTTAIANAVISYCVGAAFGRFDVRLVVEEKRVAAGLDPFAPLPPVPPGVLAQADHVPMDAPPPGYPIAFPADGFLLDDPGHSQDLTTRVQQAVELAFADGATAWREVGEVLDSRGRDLRLWLGRAFFDKHVMDYSKSRRKAPIYWQLATPSASYSVWLYYHRFTRDTMYRALNDYVTPKLKHEERKLTSLTQDAGPNPSASQRKEIDAQERFVDELRALREEVARVAPLWNPDLNDGVIINFAPLWRLVPQNRSWQKECKAVWDKLVAGDYDWAHLAMHLWPERVVPKCAKDRSLAIAHGLEEVFWEEDAEGKWKPKRVPKDVVERLVEERGSTAVKSALDDLVRAPSPTAASGGRRGSGRRRSAANGRSAAAPRARGNATGTEAAVDGAMLNAVKGAIAASNGGASKAEVTEATGISSSDWNAAINALLAQGAVIKTGAARGTRYQLAAEEETA